MKRQEPLLVEEVRYPRKHILYMLRRVSLIAFRCVEGSRLILVDVYFLSNFFSLTHDTGCSNALYRANREYPHFP